MKNLKQFLTESLITESVFKISKNKIKNVGNTIDIINYICKKCIESHDYLVQSSECVKKIAEFVREICNLNNIELPEVIDDKLDTMDFLSDDSYEIFDTLIDLDDDKVYKPTKRDIVDLFISIVNNIEY